MGSVTFTVSFRDHKETVTFRESATLAELGSWLQKHWSDVDPDTLKILHRGKILRLAQNTTLHGAGVRDGSQLKVMASSKQQVTQVQKSKEIPGMASFEHEEERERRRQQPNEQPSGPSLFQKFEVWDAAGLQPQPSEALKLLHKLASDPGILGIMKRYGWVVNLLSEMPPEGKVGVSPVCLLGVNVNKGEEISLRLRTDDLKGLRRYDRVRETLIHELAHMVHSDHDNAFKEFNSRLKREVEQLDWKGAAGARSLTYAGFKAAQSPTLFGSTPMSSEGQPVQGRVLVEGGGGSHVATSPRTAAAEAASQRAEISKKKADTVVSYPIDVGKNQSKSMPYSFKKGDAVEYRGRDGTWTPAVVVSVDLGIIPPSYGIELSGGYRETEAERLRIPSNDTNDHFDPLTAAKEEQVHRLYEQ
jgi:hypothetical protein